MIEVLIERMVEVEMVLGIGEAWNVVVIGLVSGRVCSSGE